MGRFEVWSMPGGEMQLEISAGLGRIRSLAYLPAGDKLVSAGDGRTIKLWDATSGDEVKTFTCPSGKVLSMAVCGEHLLATGGSDNVVRVWNWQTQSEVDKLRRPHGLGRGVGFRSGQRKRSSRAGLTRRSGSGISTRWTRRRTPHTARNSSFGSADGDGRENAPFDFSGRRSPWVSCKPFRGSANGWAVPALMPPTARCGGPRLCRFEEIEARRMMAADLHVGASYYDPASGLDTVPNVFQIEFKGGAADTQLTHLRIDGSKDGGPLTFNDAIFDTAAGGLGAYGYSPFKVVQSNGFQVTGVQVADGGTSLDINFSGFKAGMILIFTIDVDQVLFIDNSSNNGDVQVDAVDEGAEFQRSHFVADFSAPHYQNLSTDTKFWDVYDSNFAADDKTSGVKLDLPTDRYTNPDKDQSVLTAGATAVAVQQPLPDSIAGVVYADANLNNHQDPGDNGIGNVTLTLYQFNGQQYVSTGRTTTTDAQGNYKFSNVLPGEYRVVETQPSPYFSVGATAGNVLGSVRGTVTTPDIISDITLLGGEDSVHNDFSEALPNSISGHVGNDTTGDCENNPTPGIPNVTMQLLDSTGKVVATTTTDANGNYHFDNVRAGTYTVNEIQPAGWLEDDDHVGSAGGVLDGPDRVKNIVLTSNIKGVGYDFCEVLPVSIAGHVGIASGTDDGGCADGTNPPIAGVTIQLLNSSGTVIATTKTDANGNYLFDALPPDTYTVHEIQPAGYFEGDDHAGSQGGTLVDVDTIGSVALFSGMHGINYNFCEVLPVSIAGHVGIATGTDDGGCANGTNPPIAGVTVQLLNSSGTVIATTTTDENGNYLFDTLPPGTYGVHEIQPAGYYEGDDHVGSAGGTIIDIDTMGGTQLINAIHATNYNFCEVLPVSIAGHVGIETGTDDGGCADGTNPPIRRRHDSVARLDRQDRGHDRHQRQWRLPVRHVAPRHLHGARDSAGRLLRGGRPRGLGRRHAGRRRHDRRAQLINAIHATNYNFCEVPPSDLCGYVYVDLNNNGVKDPGEQGIAGAKLTLVDANGNSTGITTTTDATGFYCFMTLMPGTYGVAETQPAGYYDGLDAAGTAGGVAHNPGDLITGAVLLPGMDGDDYDFGELLPASISGQVHAQQGPNCDVEDGATPLSGVVMHLLDANGNVVPTTTTGENGMYYFNDLAPGTYTVLEEQPAAYFENDADVGSAGGDGRQSGQNLRHRADRWHGRRALRLLRNAAGHAFGLRVPGWPADRGAKPERRARRQGAARRQADARRHVARPA